ncbi:MAG: glycosyltransferase, partial [Planctomycetes bacterium]|nr:glycosyltransferase [Planctomycetota bacterium]
MTVMNENRRRREVTYGSRVLVVCWELDKPSETFIRQIVDRLPMEVTSFEWLKSPPGMGIRQQTISQRIARRFFSAEPPVDKQVQQVRNLVKTIREQQINVVLGETGPLAALIASACDEAAVPLVAHFHGVDAYSTRLTGTDGENYRSLFRSVAGVICVSHHMCQQLPRLGADPRRVHYVSSYVDPDKFSATQAESSAPVFLAVGRLVEKKAPLITLMAFARVLAHVPSARLQLVGDGPMSSACLQFVKAAGIAYAVELMGVQPHESVATLMKSARCFVQHSVVGSDNDHEGTPVGILEAQISGLPVVSTRHAGIPDVVQEGVTGFLVDEFDVEEMARQMIKIAEDAELAGQMGRAARDIVSSKFSFERTLGQLSRILHEAANPLFPALRSGHRLFQRPSPQKQIPISGSRNLEKEHVTRTIEQAPAQPVDPVARGRIGNLDR